MADDFKPILCPSSADLRPNLAVAFGWRDGDMDVVPFIARLCLIACLAMTLAMPRMAWAAHQIGHPPVGVTETHALAGHHDDGHHHADAADEKADKDDKGGNTEEGSRQPVHTHGGVSSLTAFDLPTITVPAAWALVSDIMHFERVAAQLSPADSPLEKRPPRFV